MSSENEFSLVRTRDKYNFFAIKPTLNTSESAIWNVMREKEVDICWTMLVVEKRRVSVKKKKKDSDGEDKTRIQKRSVSNKVIKLKGQFEEQQKVKVQVEWRKVGI